MTTLSQRLRQKLLDLAIHGKLVPQDPHDEPAEKLLARIRRGELPAALTQRTQSTQRDAENLDRINRIYRIEGEAPPNNTLRSSAPFAFSASAPAGRKRNPVNPVNPVKQLPPITDDEKPFDLPKGWTWCQLGEITTKVGAGSTPKGGKEVYVASGVKFIREQNVYCDGLHNEGMVFIDEATNQRMSGTIVCPGDMLMNITGGSIGRTALVSDDFDIGNVNQHVLIIRAAEPETRKYIHLVLCSPLIVRLMFSRQTGDKPGLSAEKVKAFPIPLPPLAEQKRIVAALDEMLAAADAVAAGTEKIAALKEKARAKILDLAIRGKLVKQEKDDEPADVLLARIRRGELPAALTQRAQSSQRGAESSDRINRIYRIESEGGEASLRSSAPFAFSASAPAGRKRNPVNPVNPVKKFPPITDDEMPFDLPKGWAWCRLGEIGTWGAGTTPSRKNAAYYEGGEIPWLKTGDLNDGVITGVPEFVTQKALDETSLHVNPVGTVLIAMYGATIGKIGILGIEATTNQACCACQVAGCVVNKYLFYYLLSQRSKLKAMGGGGAQPNISKDIIVSYPIPLPPLVEQKRIVAKVDEMLAACEELGMRNGCEDHTESRRHGVGWANGRDAIRHARTFSNPPCLRASV